MFYLSKIVWAFLQPSTLIAIVLVAGFLLVARGKRAGLPVLFCGVALYLIAGFSPLANWLLVPLETRAQIGMSEPVDGAAGIIVLGGATAGAQNFGERRVILNDAADRMIEAVRLAQQYPDLPVIFSGGNDDIFPSSKLEPEAQLARRFFEGFNITPPRLRLENRSRNTFENAAFTAKLMQPRLDQRWVLVTSAFHMPRARALFEAQGFHVIPRPGDFRTNGSQDLWQIFGKPSDGLRRLDMAAKEWVGLLVSWLGGDIAWPHGRDDTSPVGSASLSRPSVIQPSPRS
jgi:uncharacterized SAM-binding protein YcdF (DUF218 family)